MPCYAFNNKGLTIRTFVVCVRNSHAQKPGIFKKFRWKLIE